MPSELGTPEKKPFRSNPASGGRRYCKDNCPVNDCKQ